MNAVGGVFGALLTSRKFWLAVIGALVAGIAYFQGTIDADALVTAIVTLMTVVIGSIAVEDAALKFGIREVAALPEKDAENE